MMLILKFIFTGLAFQVELAEVRTHVDLDLQVKSSLSDWSSAQKSCRQNMDILLPELGYDPLNTEKLYKLSPGEFHWMNAKSVIIEYGDKLKVNVKFSYRPADSELTSYLCYNITSPETERNTTCEPLSWQKAQDICHSAGKLELLNVSTPQQLEKFISMLKEDVTFWVDKMSDLMLPNMVSDTFQMTEECWGVMKQLDGSITYRQENCSKRHQFICVSKAFEDQLTRMAWTHHKSDWRTSGRETDPPDISATTVEDQFAPTVTRMAWPHHKSDWRSSGRETDPPDISATTVEDQFAPTVTRMAWPCHKSDGRTFGRETDPPDTSAASGSYIAFLIVTVMLLLAALVAWYYLRRRWWRRKAYRRYMQIIFQQTYATKNNSAELRSYHQPGSHLTREHQIDFDVGCSSL